MTLLLFYFCTLVLLLSWTEPLWAAITFDVASSAIADGVNSTSHTHAVGGGCTDPIIVVSVASYVSGGATVSAMSIGGSSATPIDSELTYDRRLELWYRKGVSTGNNTIAVTLSTTVDAVNTSARSYCGVNQTTSLGSSVSSVDLGTNPPSIDVTSDSGDMVIDVIISRVDTAVSLTVGTGQTERTNAVDFFGTLYIHGESDEAGGATATTMNWTQTGGLDSWWMIGVALKPSSGTPTARRRVVVVQ